MSPFWFLVLFIAFSPFLSPFFTWEWEKTTNYSIGVFLLFMLFCIHIWAFFSFWEYYLMWLIFLVFSMVSNINIGFYFDIFGCKKIISKK